LRNTLNLRLLLLLSHAARPLAFQVLTAKVGLL
jgi:hypothetical protein